MLTICTHVRLILYCIPENINRFGLETSYPEVRAGEGQLYAALVHRPDQERYLYNFSGCWWIFENIIYQSLGDVFSDIIVISGTVVYDFRHFWNLRTNAISIIIVIFFRHFRHRSTSFVVVICWHRVQMSSFPASCNIAVISGIIRVVVLLWVESQDGFSAQVYVMFLPLPWELHLLKTTK